MLNHKKNYIKYSIGLIIGVFVIVMITGMVVVDKRQLPPAQVIGVFWQPDLHSQPEGNWDLLGVTTFIPQFGTVDGKSWFQGERIPAWQTLPNWKKVKQQAWSKHLILGLSGRYNETEARAQVEALGVESLNFLKNTDFPFKADAYYFPVEADPTWLRVHALGKTLETLPKPLWVSIYSAEAEPLHYDLWLKSWLPEQTNVFFQDGVGTGVRTAEQAVKIANQLNKTIGDHRVLIILEAFRMTEDHKTRAATPWEIIEQLKAYEGQQVYIFDGPHYMSRWSVYTVALWQKLAYRRFL